MSTVSPSRLAALYERITEQLAELFEGVEDPVARMATAAALLHHKMGHFFWTGFYRLEDGELLVGPYQGFLACAELEQGKGVCWSGIDRNETIVVPDVHDFEGHITCDERSRSEIVVPVREPAGNVVAVLDVDSDQLNAFGDVDRRGLEKIADLIYCC